MENNKQYIFTEKQLQRYVDLQRELYNIKPYKSEYYVKQQITKTLEDINTLMQDVEVVKNHND